MPATPKPRPKNVLHLIASWPLLSKKFSCQAFQKYGCGILAGIRAVLSRHRAGFDWKEVAASLHISGFAADESFWSELKRTASNRMRHRLVPEVIEEPKAQDTSQIPKAKTSQ